MRPTFKKTVVCAAATVMVAVTATVTGTAHAASPTSFVTRDSYLVHNAHQGMPTSCVSRQLRLAAGTYNWGRVGTDIERRPGHYTMWQDLRLDAGNYKMEACLEPRNNSFYAHWISLNPDNPALPTVNRWATVEFDTGVRSWILGSNPAGRSTAIRQVNLLTFGRQRPDLGNVRGRGAPALGCAVQPGWSGG
jgi:hypothetical protein